MHLVASSTTADFMVILQKLQVFCQNISEDRNNQAFDWHFKVFLGLRGGKVQGHHIQKLQKLRLDQAVQRLLLLIGVILLWFRHVLPELLDICEDAEELSP